VFVFQAEDGIRDWSVTGVQTCALPIYAGAAVPGEDGQARRALLRRRGTRGVHASDRRSAGPGVGATCDRRRAARSERVHRDRGGERKSVGEGKEVTAGAARNGEKERTR